MRHSGHQWDRVTGPDLDTGKAERHKLNLETLKSKVFIAACEKVETRQTLKQAGKYRRKKGKAYCG